MENNEIIMSAKELKDSREEQKFRDDIEYINEKLSESVEHVADYENCIYISLYTSRAANELRKKGYTVTATGNTEYHGCTTYKVSWEDEEVD